MKKGMSIFLKIITALMILGAVECFIFALMYDERPDPCEHIRDISVSEIDEYTVVYCQELTVLQRYAFQTVSEYRDSEGSYEESTYYVYDDSQPMDKNELFAQYYLVQFCDQSGTEYIASLCVSADDAIASSLTELPLKLSGCFGASPTTRQTLLNTSDPQLSQLRDAALNAYPQNRQAPVTLGYITQSVAQYREDFAKDVTGLKIAMAVLGAALTVVSIFLIRFIRKKSAKREQ